MITILHSLLAGYNFNHSFSLSYYCEHRKLSYMYSSLNVGTSHTQMTIYNKSKLLFLKLKNVNSDLEKKKLQFSSIYIYNRQSINFVSKTVCRHIIE